MEFKKAFKDMINKQRRRAGSKAYVRNGELFLSRIFGFNLVDGKYISDPRYEPAIRTIFEMLAQGSSLPVIKAKLDGMKARDSSHNPYGASRILAIGERMTYSGFMKQGLKLIRIKNMTPIVSLETWRLAQKTIRRERGRII